jgi:hypothetical protein
MVASHITCICCIRRQMMDNEFQKKTFSPLRNVARRQLWFNICSESLVAPYFWAL